MRPTGEMPTATAYEEQYGVTPEMRGVHVPGQTTVYEAVKTPERLRPGDDMEKGGVKFDQGKTRDELIPPEVEEALATVLAFGASKYADRNWEKGMEWSRPYAASRRHLRNWFARRDFGKGPGKDKDSGYSDLWHAYTNIAFLIAYEARGVGKDDRPGNPLPGNVTFVPVPVYEYNNRNG